MAVNRSLRITAAKFTDKPTQSKALRIRTRVCRPSGRIKAACLSDSYGASIMPQTMRSDFRLGSAGTDPAVKLHEIMIAYAPETAAAMLAVYIGHTDTAAGRSGRTMDNDLCNVSHVEFRV